MSNAHFTQDEFILAYYGEPDARRDHLDACHPTVRAEY